MAVETTVLCGGAAGPGLPGDNLLRLFRHGPNKNVFLEVEDLRRALWADLPDVFLDLLDVAAYVYAADQSVPRRGSSRCVWGENWRRVLHFAIPVRCPDVWELSEVGTALVDLLSFLSEDEYHFRFESGPCPDRFEAYGMFRQGRFGGALKEVVLFSGGIDSLAGAVQEGVVDHRPVALVHHRSNPKNAPSINGLRRELGQRAVGAAPHLIPVRVYKERGLTREDTQRARSFLFMALGAAVAQALGLDRVRLYENGVVSVDLPLCAQVVGVRASRTTHPRVIDGMTRLLTALAGRRFEVENPFRDRTKVDLVRLLARAHCADLIAAARSCAHPRAATNEQPHCGVCSQCLDRRLSVAAAGEEEHDPRSGYRVNVLTGEVPDGMGRTMVAVFAETVLRWARMSQAEFLARYGEVGRLLDVGGGAAATAAAVYELHRRHGQELARAIEDAVTRQASSALWRTGESTCLLRMVTGDPAPEGVVGASAAAPAQLPENVFRRNGRAWQVRFAGGRPFVLLPSLGAAYLHVLLQRPGRPMSLFDLVRAVSEDPRRFALSGDDADLDEQAEAALRARAVELAGAITAARRENNTVQVDLFMRELTELEATVRKRGQFAGRSQRERDPYKRLRSRVYMALKRVVTTLGNDDVRLGEHLTLKSPNLRCGNNPSYDPRPPIDWDTDPLPDGAQH
jgi:7-cyano-7-deazaguanine synthase in queuosine biosynthesis